MANQGAFFVQLIRHLIESRTVPEASDLAAWMEERRGGYVPADFDRVVNRLKTWPKGHPYPAYPDDAALKHGVHRPDPRWWVPGTAPSEGAVRETMNTIGHLHR